MAKDDFFDGVIQGTIWGAVFQIVIGTALCFIAAPILGGGNTGT